MKDAIDEMEEKCRTLCLITVNEAVKLAKREALKKQAEEIRNWLMDECDTTPKDCFIIEFDKRFYRY